jgi:hypothetical protein
MKKMTIYYKKRTLELDAVVGGENDLKVYGMDLEDAELIYGYFVIDYNEYLLRHKKEFELIKDDAGNLVPQMKEVFKEQAKQFL